MSEVVAIGVGVEADGVVQCALANMCRILLDTITSEWVRLAPEVLGDLLPVVHGLPQGRSLAERFGLATALRAPPPLFIPWASLPFVLAPGPGPPPRFNRWAYHAFDARRSAIPPRRTCERC